jgi:hypothetical protein
MQAAAAKDVGWQGSSTDELLNAELNITLMTAYMVKCTDWANKYDKLGDVAKYGLWQCALSVYNQGPGGFASRGITRNLNSYVQPIMTWAGNIQAGGIYPDDGSVPNEPPPSGPGEPPIPPVPTGQDTITTLTKWSEGLAKSLEDIKRVRPWPPESDFQTELGLGIYHVAEAIRIVRTHLEQWLGELEG